MLSVITDNSLQSSTGRHLCHCSEKEAEKLNQETKDIMTKIHDLQKYYDTAVLDAQFSLLLVCV